MTSPITELNTIAHHILNQQPLDYQPDIILDKDTNTLEYTWHGHTHGIQLEEVGPLMVATVYKLTKTGKHSRIKALPVCTERAAENAVRILIDANMK